jgi:hypothetical protein
MRRCVSGCYTCKQCFRFECLYCGNETVNRACSRCLCPTRGCHYGTNNALGNWQCRSSICRLVKCLLQQVLVRCFGNAFVKTAHQAIFIGPSQLRAESNISFETRWAKIVALSDGALVASCILQCYSLLSMRCFSRGEDLGF